MNQEMNTFNDAFFRSVRSILSEARRKAVASINFVMVEAYWRIGQRIVEEEQKGQTRAGYGQELIKELSKRLGDEFGKGFSVANIKNFRQFYLTFPDFQKGYALRSELGWSHYRLIMRVDEPEARQFYIGEAANHGWTTRELERNIRSGWRQRLLPKGSILITCIAGSPSCIGNAGVANREVAFNQQINAFVPSKKVLMWYDFGIFWIGKKLIQNASTNSMKGMVSKTVFSGIEIPLPPLDLQNRFATIAESIEQQKTRLRGHLAELDILFSSLQSRAFKGEL